MTIDVDAIWDGVGIALRVGLGVTAWHAARVIASPRFNDGHPRAILAYVKVTIVCAIVAFASWAVYGVREGEGWTDPTPPPTEAQRDRHGIALFVGLVLIGVHGTWFERKHPDKVLR